MPITRGAKKALRQSIKKRNFNRARKDGALSAIKSVKKLIADGKKKESLAAFRLAQKAIDKAVKGKTITKNTASRKKSRISKMIKKLG